MVRKLPQLEVSDNNMTHDMDENNLIKEGKSLASMKIHVVIKLEVG